MTTGTRQDDDPQGGMFDLEIVDRELAAACADMDMDADARKRYVKNATLRRSKIKAMEADLRAVPGFEDGGARVRVRANEEDPGYLLTVKPRAGGGFEVPEWESVGVTTQARA